ncbi:uncharacterized protein A4U43_C05F23290 [Asparagus officinalis]|uniref:Uncharacterized protein n=1 Tax=Asparagus officinalis TaxID=4686 RepID=A0A5P1EZ85_ASPOF|nr:uncharacterized protein LOC109840324 [Asparagus officinalis]ONK69470.1 uncharacterized protein A4U43_C05F23290 [Asparagus officinalis]
MAAAIEIAPISFILHPAFQIENKANISVPTQRLSFSHPWTPRKLKSNVCCSSNSDPKAEENGSNTTNELFPSPDDADYLWKLAAGSVGGGAAIKYGSILFPDLTRPNILQALLMISLPVMVAVLILIKESRSES